MGFHIDLYFNPETGRFYLEAEIQNLIYRQKNVICSYSGSNEWCNHFACELISLYSGGSIYNYALGTCNYETEIPALYQEGKGESVVRFIQKNLHEDWFIHAFETFKYVIDNLVEV
jgi:hypothetical protein